jgi:hypothetical protein
MISNSANLVPGGSASTWLTPAAGVWLDRSIMVRREQDRV